MGRGYNYRLRIIKWSRSGLAFMDPFRKKLLVQILGVAKPAHKVLGTGHHNSKFDRMCKSIAHCERPDNATDTALELLDAVLPRNAWQNA